MNSTICLLIVALFAFSSCTTIERAKVLAIPAIEKRVDQGIENATSVLCRLPVTAVVRNTRKRGNRWLTGMALICPESLGVLLGANR